MAEPFPSADSDSTHPPETASALAPEQSDAPEEGAIESRFKQKKLLVVLGTTALGGVLLGVGAMTVISYIQPSAREHQASPAIVAPVRDIKQEAQVAELKELKAKNEKLEEQLKLALPASVSAPEHDAVVLPAPASASEPVSIAAPVSAPSPTVFRHRSAGVGTKEKVTADCTVPDKDEKLGEKLKSCIEGFNASTH